MKRLLFAFALLTVAASSFGQSIALTTPVADTTKPYAIVREFHVDDTTQTAWVRVRYTQNADGSGANLEPAVLQIPLDPNNPGTEYVDFLTAIGSAAPNETGGPRRRGNYRIMYYFTVTHPRAAVSGTPTP